MPPALDRQPVAQHPLLGERRRGEARPRARSSPERPSVRAAIRHRVALRVDLDPGVLDIRPPRTPARARPAQRRTLARAQHQVRAGVRPRQEARAAGVAAQIEPRQPGQRLEYPVLEASRTERVVVQVSESSPRPARRTPPPAARSARCSFRKRDVTPLSPSKSPGFSAAMPRLSSRSAVDPGESSVSSTSSSPSPPVCSPAPPPPARRAPAACARTPRRSAPATSR